jgi:rhomboid protease GluP
LFEKLALKNQLRRGDRLSLFVRRESFKQYITKFPITTVIIVINVIYFALMHLYPGINQADTLIKWGAYYFPGIQNGEYYRFLTPVFMQIDVSHFLFNMFAIFVFVAAMEPLIGKGKYLFIYLVSGIVGFIATYFFSSADLGLGASGAVFGILGAFLYLIQKKSALLDPASKKTILPILIINVIFTFIEPNISITGHIGGLIAGYLIAWGLRIELKENN